MSAVYNEIEPYAADWLVNLEREGHVAPGIVDRRSIADVIANDVAIATSSTRSRASDAGHLRSVSPVSQMMMPFGPGLAPVSRSAQRASAADSTTLATSGPSGSGSSASASLQSSLESRLRVALASSGSTLFSLTWRARVTPARRRICALRASGRRTSGSASTSWPTPKAWDGGGGGNAKRAGTRRSNLKDSVLLTWWSTPTARDWKDGSPNENVPTNALLGRQVWSVDSGPTLSGSLARMAKRGQLNPAHSRWLMGLTRAWDACAPVATRSSRKSPIENGVSL
jgi:hypothetical protein